MSQSLKLERKGQVQIITISRPKVLNALDTETYQGLLECLNQIFHDSSIKVVVITGEGEKAFASGTDITEMQHMNVSEARNLAFKVKETLDTIEKMPKVFIAAINGYAFGGGCELALACDIRVASQKAKLGQPEINLGIIPGGGGTQRLARIVGLPKAKELVFEGKIISAIEAEKIGLVNKVVEPQKLMDEVLMMANVIAQKPPIALKLAKASLNSVMNTNLNNGLEYEIECFAQCFATEDRVEGFKAFLEKREAKFKGK